MHKSLLLLTTLVSSIAFAQTTPTNIPTTTDSSAAAVMPANSDDSGPGSKECDTIANACLAAGYDNTNTSKRFWQDCMRSLLINQNVTGVTVATTDIAACRDYKIIRVQQELQDLQNAKTTPAATMSPTPAPATTTE